MQRGGVGFIQKELSTNRWQKNNPEELSKKMLFQINATLYQTNDTTNY